MQRLLSNEVSHWIRLGLAIGALWIMFSRIPTHDELKEELRPMQEEIQILNLRIERLEIETHLSNKAGQ